MEKRFFVKYLPVEGHFHYVGAVIRAKDGSGIAIIKKVGEGLDERQWDRVKLFLCSRDIQVGDKDIYAEPQATESHQKGLRLELVSIEDLEGYKNAKIKYLANPKRPDCIGNIRDWPAGNLWKVIGEVSPEATWVKEGDEFGEYKLVWTVNYPFTEVGKDKGADEFYTKENKPKFVMVKGLCGHFH